MRWLGRKILRREWIYTFANWLVYTRGETDTPDAKYFCLLREEREADLYLAHRYIIHPSGRNMRSFESRGRAAVIGARSSHGDTH